VRAVAVLGDWSCSTFEGLDRVGGSWAVPVPSLPLGLLGVVSRVPPAIPSSPRGREAERVTRTDFAGGVGITAPSGWSPPAVLARGVHVQLRSS
jgi:hypothetical protein